MSNHEQPSDREQPVRATEPRLEQELNLTDNAMICLCSPESSSDIYQGMLSPVVMRFTVDILGVLCDPHSRSRLT